MLDNSIKYVQDCVSGSEQYVWRTRTYGAPEVADVDQFVTAMNPVADAAWHTLTLLTEYPDVPRCASITTVDANGSINVVVELKGFDQFGNQQTEILRRTGTSGTTKGMACWSRITSARYRAYGTQGGGDTLSVGVCNRLGFPVQIVNDEPYEQVRLLVSDTAGAPADELASANTVINADYSWVEPNVAPDGTKVFFTEILRIAPEATKLLARPRISVIFAS